MAQRVALPYGDRRARRRQETIGEILDVALEVMAEEGVAALTLTEVARRMGIRPPSLYQYFASKMAIYDALFGEGYRRVNAAQREAAAGVEDCLALLRASAQCLVAWCLANPVLAQIMYARTVPGFEPSQESYAPSVKQLEDLHAQLKDAVAAGALEPAAASGEGVALFTSLIGGLIAAQFANEPDAPTGEGRYTGLTQKALDMFFSFYAPGKEETGDYAQVRHGRSARRSAN